MKSDGDSGESVEIGEKLRATILRAVVVYCHSKFVVMARFLFRAQDHNMTNGDFAYFTWGPLRRGAPRQPWIKDVRDPSDRPRRRQAYYAVKQVG